jgi:predicted nucleic acid-binding protein
MPASVERGWAADTSFAVAAVDESHEAHPVSRTLAMRRRPALAGHAAFEVHAVLTRLPGTGRVHPDTAIRPLAQAFPTRCWLTARQHDRLLSRLGELGSAGGATYDALVGEAARAAGLRLLARDQRARRVYDLLGVAFELVD